MPEQHTLGNLMQKIDLIAKEHAAVKVLKVKLLIGALNAAEPELLTRQFLIETEGTIAEGAELILEKATDANARHAFNILLKSIELEQ